MDNTAQVAKTLAEKVERDAIAHELLCAERYRNIEKSIAEIKGIMKWAGSLVIMLILSVLGWSLVQQYNANEATKQRLQEQVEFLQSQATAGNRP